METLLEKFDHSFYAEIIQNYLKIPSEDFTFKSSKIASASAKNENFVSDIYRLTIEFQTAGTEPQSFDVILKVSFDLVSEIKQLSVFTREQLMYQDMIASFEKIWHENGHVVSFAPKCYKITEIPYDLIVLEDLKADGYEMLSRKHGLDLRQTKTVLSKLAKFHAASAVRFVKDNKTIAHCLDRVATHVKHPPDSPILATMKMVYNKLIEVAQLLKLSEECISKLSQLPLDVLMDSYFDVAYPMKCGLRVLIHADLWINNMMFNDDSEDVKFLDFQISFWGNPNADLMYFLFSSVMDDVKVKNFDEIIEFYYEELRGSLKMLKYHEHIPTVEELREDLMENRMYAIQLFLLIIPMTRNFSPTNMEIKDLFSGSLTDETLNSVYMDENVLKVIGSWLPFMNKRGFLDYK